MPLPRIANCANASPVSSRHWPRSKQDIRNLYSEGCPQAFWTGGSF
jgi:hypothetical protein